MPYSITDLQWRNIIFCILLPLLGLCWSVYQPLYWKTVVLASAYYFAAGIGITAGYHRLWSHRSFTASLLLQYFLAICSAASVQGSILTWCRDHRAHHHYVDTPKDPYNVQKGFLWAHMGWLIFKPDPKLIGRVDVSDLASDPVVIWQHNNFPLLCLSFAYILPTVIAWIGWNDPLGGLLYAGILRTFCFQQATNCVNSLAHYLGEQPYTDLMSPRDHIFTAIVTFGEGYHNFHHEFPSDYRNGVRWLHYDPTKWFITIWNWIGLAGNLQRFSANEIEKARFQQSEKLLIRWRKKIHWGPPLELLPVYTWDEYEALCSQEGESRLLTCIAGVLYDLSAFEEKHPGGKYLIRSSVGRDATAAFNGGVYSHTKAAHNLLDCLRFGVLLGGNKVAAHTKSCDTGNEGSDWGI